MGHQLRACSLVTTLALACSAGPAATTSDGAPASSDAGLDDTTTGSASATSAAATSAGPEPGASSTGVAPGDTSDGGSTADGSDGPACLVQTDPCTAEGECCEGLTCGTTTLGQVCCGNEGIACATENGEDCCGALWCMADVCGTCEPDCTEAPALVIEKQRLAAIGGDFLGICGDANHTYGFHVPAANLPSDDYSLEGAANTPLCPYHAAAIDIGMGWNASREWLGWLIEGIRTDQLTGIAEVIGSYDGVNVRYWSDSAGWSQEGIPYTGSGHDHWTHVSIYRSTAMVDHGILAGWTADGMQ